MLEQARVVDAVLETSVVRVRVVNAAALTRHGITSILKEADPHITLVDPHEQSTPVDLTLFDNLTSAGPDIAAAVEATTDPLAGDVVILTWAIPHPVLMSALAKGCRGCIDKASSAPEIAAAIRSIYRGEVFVSPNFEFATTSKEPRSGLSSRESDMLALIVEGYSNAEIAQLLYLSTNTVKTYIRSAYKKIGIERRPEAVRWGIEQGIHLRIPSTLSSVMLPNRPTAKTL